mgnify:CR=1 FL=1
MSGKIKIDTQRCKGCGLCVAVCPKKSIATSEKSNRQGFFPAEHTGGPCSGCAMCALVCPEAVIEVLRDDQDSGQQKLSPAGKPDLIRKRL